MDDTSTKENLLHEFKLSYIAIPYGIILLFLVIILLLLLFNQGLSFSSSSTTKTSTKTNNEITSDVFIILTFLLLICLADFIYLMYSLSNFSS